MKTSKPTKKREYFILEEWLPALQKLDGFSLLAVEFKKNTNGFVKKIKGQVFEEYETDGIYSQTKGFYYDTTRKESIITSLQAIYSDYSTELRTGTSDPDVVIPKMRKRMEAAGFDELLEDVQSQLNEWMEKVDHEETESEE